MSWEASSLPRTGQGLEGLQDFLQANLADLSNYVAGTLCPEVLGGVTAVLGPASAAASGILCGAVGKFLSEAIDKCFDPFEKNRRWRESLDRALQTVAQHMPKLPPPPPPAPQELPLLRWAKARATFRASFGQVGEDAQPTWRQDYQTYLGIAPLVLPGPTEVTVSWVMHAGAGGICDQDAARVLLLGQDGTTYLDREGEATYGVPNITPFDDHGSQTLQLPSGNYLLIAAVSGEQGSFAEVSADYLITSVTIPAQVPAAAWALIAGGALLMLSNGRGR